MSDLLICPDCQHENSANARKCAACGMPLGGNTTIWKGESVAEALQAARPVQPGAEFAPDTLYLYLVGAKNPDPVRFPGMGTIILGRKNADGPNDPSLFDLNPYHGYSLGISRQHARITRDELGYMIEDLNSSNGTRVKGNVLEPGRTYPLRSGDDLRLGDLLIFVYYS